MANFKVILRQPSKLKSIITKPSALKVTMEKVTQKFLTYTLDFDSGTTNYAFYTMHYGSIVSIETSNIASYTINLLPVTLPYHIETETLYSIDIVKETSGSAQMIIKVSAQDYVKPLTIEFAQLTTNPNYTWYDVQVGASGGVAPYTGTGIFARQYGTYSFTVTDSEGTSVTESFKVEAPIPNATHQIYAVMNDSGTYATYCSKYYQVFGAQTNYINWGDGTDEIYVSPAGNVYKYHLHQYSTPGWKNIQVLKIVGNVETAKAIDYFYANVSLNLEYFKDRVKPILMQFSPEQNLFGNLKHLAIIKETGVRRRLYFWNYSYGPSNVYGDIKHLKYYDVEMFRYGGSGEIPNIYGDLSELFNQDYDHIVLSFQNIPSSAFSCSAIDPGYTANKSIRSLTLSNVGTITDTVLTNILLQIRQNQIRTGGAISIFGVPGKINLSDPVVLEAKTFLVSTLGWTVTIPNY